MTGLHLDFLLAAGAVLLAAAVSAFVYVKNENNSMDELFEANVEALTNDESVITCDSGICGRCFVEEHAWPFYKCNWTGVQSNYCDCDKTGWL